MDIETLEKLEELQQKKNRLFVSWLKELSKRMKIVEDKVAKDVKSE